MWSSHTDKITKTETVEVGIESTEFDIWNTKRNIYMSRKRQKIIDDQKLIS